MNEEILKKLEQKVGRRSFLKGSGLAAATLIGVFAASPLVGLAQQQPPPPPNDKKKDDPKKDDAADQKKKDDDKADEGGADKETKIDAEGHEYPRMPAVRLEHVSPGSHLDVRKLRIQLHRVVGPR